MQIKKINEAYKSVERMSNLIEIKKRITSIESTIKVTKVMQMIATAKIAKIKHTITISDRYNKLSKSILTSYIQNTSNLDKINLFINNAKDNKKKILLILMSSDKGTCGSINTNIFKKLSFIVDEYKKYNSIIDVFAVGKKAKKYLELQAKRLNVNEILQNVDVFSENHNEKTINTAINSFIEKYNNGEYDKILFIYNKFKNIITCEPFCEQVLPLIENIENNEKENFTNISETDSICYSIISLLIKTKFYNAYVSNLASIISSRMNAMDNATKNGQEIIDDLRIKYNKSRQSNITSELSDIVSGFSAIS